MKMIIRPGIQAAVFRDFFSDNEPDAAVRQGIAKANGACGIYRAKWPGSGKTGL